MLEQERESEPRLSHNSGEDETHSWLHPVHLSFVPGPLTPLLEETITGLRQHLTRQGNTVQERPDNDTDAIITTARFGEPLPWRQALMFFARRRFQLDHGPTVFTLMHARPVEVKEALSRIEDYLKLEGPDAERCRFPGLAARGHEVMFEQGKRGGPVLALERLAQAQAKCLRVILLVGEERPERAYHFDLAGAFPTTRADDLDEFYEDLVLRLMTALSTGEVTKHQVVGEPVPAAVWSGLKTPAAMAVAARELNRRRFFTRMLVISDLVNLPTLNDAIASQYSEGCFATWDPDLGALIATITGSARPVDKGNIGEDDLAVIVGVRPGGVGAQVRHVEGKSNLSPSSESVEMIEMDGAMPGFTLGEEWPSPAEVPALRSKLHGHRGVAAYDPQRVEYAPMAPAFHRYPVGCGTGAQAQGITAAFARARSPRDPSDPRQVVFTVMPGHGVMLAERWVPGKAPFQVLWEYMDAGYVQIESPVPQGPMRYVPDGRGMMVLSVE